MHIFFWRASTSLGLDHFCRRIYFWGGHIENFWGGKLNSILSFLQQSRKKTPTTGIWELKVRNFWILGLSDIPVLHIHKICMHVDTDSRVVTSWNIEWYFVSLFSFILKIFLLSWKCIHHNKHDFKENQLAQRIENYANSDLKSSSQLLTNMS